MRILLDENLDWRLARSLAGHEVESVQKNGWAGIKNGELLTPAELSFDVFITMDGNIEFQQNYPPCHWGRHVANLRDETDRGL